MVKDSSPKPLSDERQPVRQHRLCVAGNVQGDGYRSPTVLLLICRVGLTLCPMSMVCYPAHDVPYSCGAVLFDPCRQPVWREINPDIFGSMIQAVADEEERGALGMHYTSVPNILKVLNPLFLDDCAATGGSR